MTLPVPMLSQWLAALAGFCDLERALVDISWDDFHFYVHDFRVEPCTLSE